MKTNIENVQRVISATPMTAEEWNEKYGIGEALGGQSMVATRRRQTRKGSIFL